MGFPAVKPLRRLPPNLVLIGFMATGKSSVGRSCAVRLGYKFRDTDTLIERRAGKSIANIFASDGELTFRELESQAISDICRGRYRVIATGGGSVMKPENVSLLRRNGVLILLQAPVAEIIHRAGTRTNRPLLAGQEDPAERIRELLRLREPTYVAAADAVVNTTDLLRDEVIDRVILVYHSLLKERGIEMSVNN